MQNKRFKYRYLLLLLLLSVVPQLQAKTIMVLGDSLSAGYGISAQQGWVALLDQRLQQQYPKKHRVVNASVSGETTSGAMARLPKLLQTHRPDIVVIELGGNDALRGQPPQLIQKNLKQLIQLSLNSHAQVVLVGMKIPPNYGKTYSTAFENNYKILSQNYKNIDFLPFFLQGVAGHAKYMQKDQIHPNALAQPILLNNIYPYIKGAL